MTRRLKILFLQKRILFPSNTGGKIRTLNVVRHLAQWHDVTYLCNVQTADEPFVQQMRDLGVTLETIDWVETPRSTGKFYLELLRNMLSPYPYNVDKDFDPQLRKRVEGHLQSDVFDLVICDFVQMARNCLGLDAAPKLLFQHNVEAEIFKRHAQQDEGWLRRKFMGYQWKKMQRFEGKAGGDFDRVIAVSDRDREIYAQDYNWQHVSTIDTAVDTDFFQPQPCEEVSGRLVFVGSMDWLPNEDGSIYFAKEIWPEIRRRQPNATVQLVGRNPTDKVLQLGEIEGIEVTGAVDDVRPFQAQANVVIVPLRIGGGTRIKIFEALAMRKALISTTLGAEGLDITPGEHFLAADTPSDFADAVVQLLEDAALRNRLADNAHRQVVENYSAESVARQFEQICFETVDASSQAGKLIGSPRD